MRHIRTQLVLLGLIVVASPAMAGKVGFVDVEKALATVAEGKAKILELEAWSKPRQEELQQMQQRVGEMQQQIVQQRPVASSEARARMEEEELAARRRLEDATRVFQRDLDAKQTEVLRDVARKINRVVSDYAEANDFDSVFIMKERTLIYLSPASDLTETIIKLYDERFPLSKPESRPQAIP